MTGVVDGDQDALIRRRQGREGTDQVRKGRPWSLSLEDRVLLVASYWRANLTPRQLAPLFGVSKSSAGLIIDPLAPSLALQQRKRFRKTPRLSWTAPWSPPATSRWPSSRRTTESARAGLRASADAAMRQSHGCQPPQRIGDP